MQCECVIVAFISCVVISNDNIIHIWRKLHHTVHTLVQQFITAASSCLIPPPYASNQTLVTYVIANKETQIVKTEWNQKEKMSNGDCIKHYDIVSIQMPSNSSTTTNKYIRAKVMVALSTYTEIE